MILVDGFALLSYATVVEPLRAANVLGEKVLYEVTNIPLAGGMAKSSGGALIQGAGTIGGPLHYDLMLVVAGDNCTSVHDAPLFNWLRRAARTGIAIGGVSGGPVILAAAGLMTGWRMTAHWEHIPMLSEISPELLIERGLYVIDRDRITCAGGTAPLDLMHALIADHHGPALATRVSDWFIHTDVRPSRGPQRAGIIERWGTTNRKVLDVIMAMEGHIADTLTLDQLARFAELSSRQLNRLFQEKLDQTTMAFYRNLRLEKAQNLLKYSALPVIEIAILTGFSSATHFATAHTQRYGYPPSAVRKSGNA